MGEYVYVSPEGKQYFRENMNNKFFSYYDKFNVNTAMINLGYNNINFNTANAALNTYIA
jgi:hypothetical protein